MKNIKSLGGRAQAIASGLNISVSAYGQAIPAWFGRTRGPGLLIWTGNFTTVQGVSKKGTTAKGRLTGYFCSADWLLGYGPMEGIGGVWQEKSFWASFVGSQTFTGTGPNTTFNFTVNNVPNGWNLLLVLGVTVNLPFSVVYNDYGAPHSVSVSGNSDQPLHNQLFPAPNNGDWQFSNIPYAKYNSASGSPNVTVVFPTSQANCNCTVYYLYTNSTQFTPLSFVNLSFEPKLGQGGSGQPITYPEFSGYAGQNVDLGIANMMPNFTVEGKGLYGYTKDGDCNPADVLIDIICSGNFLGTWGGSPPSPVWQHGLNFTNFSTNAAAVGGIASYNPAFSRFKGIINDEPNLWIVGTPGRGNNVGLNTLRNFCDAYGIYISYRMDSQQPAAQYIQDICDLALTAPVWDGAQLSFIPYCEVSAFGNGASYTAPTASGPLVTIDDTILVLEDVKGNPKAPIVWDRLRSTENINSFDFEYTDRAHPQPVANEVGWYNPATVPIADMGDISVQGPMPGSTKSYRYIHDSQIATNIGYAILRRAVVNKRVAKFTLPPNYFWLNPMDLILLKDSSFPTGQMAFRIQKVTENEKYQLEIEAEPFVFGLNVPLAPGVGLPSGGGTPLPGTTSDPGAVNAPLIFEAIPAISSSPQLWFKICGSSQYFGGCTVWLSTDGGTTYNPVGRFYGKSVMGVIYNVNFPSHTDPDAADTLWADLTQSGGTLTSYTTSQRDLFQSLFYVAGGGTVTVGSVTLTIPYEIICYATATLQATNKYSLPPTLRRGVYGTPIVTHNIGNAIASLEDNEVFQLYLDQNWVGQALKFKFTAFNLFGQNEQLITDPTLVVYTFTPTGTVGWTWTAGVVNPPPTVTPTPAGSTGINDIYMYIPGTYTASQVLFENTLVEVVTMPQNLAGSVAKCLTAPTGAVTVTLKKNGVSIGTISFAGGATTGTITFSTAVAFNGTTDVFRVEAPSVADNTFAGFELAIKATRS